MWKAPAAGGDAVQVTAGGGFIAREALDGSSLFFTKGTPEPGLWAMKSEGGGESKLFDTGVGRNWTVGSSGIYLISSPTTDSEAYTLAKFDTANRRMSRPTPLPGTLRTFPISVITISPDERWIVYAQRDLLDYDLMLIENFR